MDMRVAWAGGPPAPRRTPRRSWTAHFMGGRAARTPEDASPAHGTRVPWAGGPPAPRRTPRPPMERAFMGGRAARTPEDASPAHGTRVHGRAARTPGDMEDVEGRGKCYRHEHDHCRDHPGGA